MAVPAGTPESRAALSKGSPGVRHAVRNLSGKVKMPRTGDVTRFITSKATSSLLPPEIPKAFSAIPGTSRKMVDAIGKGHELDELEFGKGKGPNSRVSGHADPQVILREHNRTTTLPPEHKSVRRAFRTTRSHGGEASLFRQATGGRLELHRGTRLSPGMKKHIGRRMSEIAGGKGVLGRAALRAVTRGKL